MGLDITVYEHVALVEEEHECEDEDGNWCGESKEFGGQEHIYTFNEESFSHSLGSLLRNRCYEASGKIIGFRAGSYSGYGNWRNALSLAALGVSSTEIWRTPAKWEQRPFYELINFSDCEGVFGPEVCVKLANDFREHRDIVRPKLAKIDDWYADQYDRWQEAFELAATDGMVVFH